MSQAVHKPSLAQPLLLGCSDHCWQTTCCYFPFSYSHLISLHSWCIAPLNNFNYHLLHVVYKTLLLHTCPNWSWSLSKLNKSLSLHTWIAKGDPRKLQLWWLPPFPSSYEFHWLLAGNRISSTQLLRKAFKDVTQRKVLHKQSIGIHWTIMAAKAVLAFRSQNYPTSYRISNISAEWELKDALLQQPWLLPNHYNSHTHTRAGARPDLYFVILVPLCSTIKL